MFSNALLTDLYQLTMTAGYLEQGKTAETATFELYYRRNPFQGGYAIAAGLESAVRAVMEIQFNKEDLAFLSSFEAAGSPIFREAFLTYLSTFRFQGDIRAIAEGSVVFPNEPLLQVKG